MIFFKLVRTENCTFGLFVDTNRSLTTKPWNLDIIKVMIDSIILILILGVGIVCYVGWTFSKNRPQGWFFLVVPMSVYVCMYLFLCSYVPPCNFFEASHWPSDTMISSRPLIGQPSFPTLTHLNPSQPISTHLNPF